jgi:hypothetical protein
MADDLQDVTVPGMADDDDTDVVADDRPGRDQPPPVSPGD